MVVTVRRLLAVLLPVLLPVALLTACGSDDDAPASTTLAGVEVAKASGTTAPDVTVDAPLTVTKTQTKLLKTGTGATVERGDVVTIKFVGVNGRSGKKFGEAGWTAQDDDGPRSFVLGDSVIPGFTKALTGVHAGSRVLTAVTPKDGYGPQGGQQEAGIKADDTLVYVIDVLAASAPRAQGTPVTPPPGLPTVALDQATGAPTVTVPQGVPAPGQLVDQVLIQGSGPAVRSGQYITVQYTGLKYRDGEVFDSSWKSGNPATFQIGTGSVIPGWDTGLVGKAVGSQVLLVIPPDQGYGPQGGQESAGIRADDTLIFVVDVLAAS